MSLLCSLGFHKWGKKAGFNNWSSNVIEYKKQCLRCGLVKRWVEAKR
ncbi:MAG: hypothetical protein WC595_00400 [Candidatus Nanoarchaeia archaeon]